jgi:L-Ala-D/L-Glu epimerase
VVGGVAQGSAWCALELALLDAAGKRFGCSVQRWLGDAPAATVRYDAVLPLTGPRALVVLAALIRLIGFRQVKVKVGDDLTKDLLTLRLLRRRLGPATDLRVDANCAWSADEALAAIARLRPYRLSAVEQPVPATDLDGLRRITAVTPELIVVDESLRTVAEAHTLAEQGACNAFNIRVSKCGGLLNSMRIAQIAREADLTCVVGAQVGESGILSAAGRHLAAAIKPRYVEGSAGRLLLKEDLTSENVLPGRGGLAQTFPGPGLGVTVNEETLRRHGQSRGTFEVTSARRM